MNQISTSTIIVDAIGKPCPMPLLMLKRSLKTASSVLLKASDPHSQKDVTQYCKVHFLRCEITQIHENEFHYLIES